MKKSLCKASLLALALACIPRVLVAHVERMGMPELAAASAHVVIAVVEGREVRWNPQRTLIETDYTLRVEDRLRGASPDRISLSIPGGTLGRISDDTCLTVHLEPGARYLLFLGDLDRKSLSPITGARQGAFRELSGSGLPPPPRAAIPCGSTAGRCGSAIWWRPCAPWPPRRSRRRADPSRPRAPCRPSAGTPWQPQRPSRAPCRPSLAPTPGCCLCPRTLPAPSRSRGA